MLIINQNNTQQARNILFLFFPGKYTTIQRFSEVYSFLFSVFERENIVFNLFLSDQLISPNFNRRFHSFDLPIHERQTNSPLIHLLNFFLQNRSSNINSNPEPE
jgi:hypothetical protein